MCRQHVFTPFSHDRGVDRIPSECLRSFRVHVVVTNVDKEGKLAVGDFVAILLERADYPSIIL